MTLDLDVTTPEKMVTVLIKTADRYRESTGELQAAWQDPHIVVWNKLADILERLATNIEKAVVTHGTASRQETETIDMDVAAPDHVSTALHEASRACLASFQATKVPIWKKLDSLFVLAAGSADKAVRKYV